ncbi:putative enterotoxin [Ophiocordyceps unilateralis]|uniref:Enterotoxin n=1 Tax=Ophiocordyceps unilateralis TaxID=268505 RepID=A0A2A9PSX9_OPHUN|nr:putative enterotoxin [Ophiocordyceps unilateralis]
MLASSLAVAVLLLHTSVATPAFNQTQAVVEASNKSSPSQAVSPAPTSTPDGQNSLVKRFRNEPPPPPPPPPPLPIPGTKLSWPNAASPVLEDRKEVQFVYRGERFRTPADVRAAGGFDSHAKRIFQGKHEKYRDMTEDLFHLGSSLYEHGTFSRDYSQYVSTSKLKAKAEDFAKKPNPDIVSYIYEIHSSRAMIDVDASLAGGRHYKHEKEFEVAAAYHIPWRLVRGWYSYRFVRDRGYVKGQWRPNQEYDFPKDGGPYSIAPQLAGWPEGHIAWQEEPWRKYQDRPVELWLNRFLYEKACNHDRALYNTMRPPLWANTLLLPGRFTSQKIRQGGARGPTRLDSRFSQRNTQAKRLNPHVVSPEPHKGPSVQRRRRKTETKQPDIRLAEREASSKPPAQQGRRQGSVKQPVLKPTQQRGQVNPSHRRSPQLSPQPFTRPRQLLHEISQLEAHAQSPGQRQALPPRSHQVWAPHRI